MIAPPENVAAPIVTGAAVGQNRLGPLRDSKSIVVVAAAAPPASVSARLAVTRASRAIRETRIVTPFPSWPVRPTRCRCGNFPGQVQEPGANRSTTRAPDALTPREICRSNAYRTGQKLPP